MAWTFVLKAGTDTLDLNDGTSYSVNVGGFYAPPPPKLTSYAGPNLFRHGADLVERSYGNRTVTMGLTIEATNASTLGKAVQDIWDYLRKAEEYSKDGLGSQVQLRYQWEGATGTYLFDVIEGQLDLGQGLHSPYLLKGTRARNAQLALTTKPFVTQDSETAMNFLKDPSFEIAATPLADWPAFGAGISERVTGTGKFGTAVLQMASTGSRTRREQYIATTAFATSDPIRAYAYYSVISGTGWASAIEIYFEQLDSTGGLIRSDSVYASNFTTGTWHKLTTTATATGSLGTLRWQFRINHQLFATATGTIYWDNAFVGSGTLPVAWVSGRDVANHFDDNGQAHINYLDVYGIPGDMPAPVQVKVNETQAHDEIWVGARHDTRMTSTGIWLEAEAFTSTIGGAWVSDGNAAASDGSWGRYTASGTVIPSMTASSAGAPQVIMHNVAAPPVGQFRVLAFARNAWNPTAGTSHVYYGLGYQYGGRTVDPSTTSEYVQIPSSGATSIVLRTIDLGILTIPPFKTPMDATVGTLGVRVAFWVSSATINGPILDSVFLVPIDQGGVYGSKDSAADNLWVDSRSRPEGIYRVTTADVVQEFPPGQVGSPPLLHPKGARLYFQWGSATGSIGHGATVSITYSPRYLHVGT